jgi:hypothetical protein
VVSYGKHRRIQKELPERKKKQKKTRRLAVGKGLKPVLRRGIYMIIHIDHAKLI